MTLMEISDAPMSGLPQNLNLCFQVMTYYISGSSDFFSQCNIILVLNKVLLNTGAWSVCE